MKNNYNFETLRYLEGGKKEQIQNPTKYLAGEGVQILPVSKYSINIEYVE